MPRTVPRRRNVTRLVSVRCSDADLAVLNELRSRTGLQLSSAARFAMRCVTLCDIDGETVPSFIDSIREMGRDYNDATHDLNLAARYLLSPQDDLDKAYVRARGYLERSAAGYASLAETLALTTSDVHIACNIIRASRKAVVPTKSTTTGESRRLNFRVDEPDAEALDHLAGSLGVTRTCAVRTILAFVTSGTLEVGERCVLFNDRAIPDLVRERRRWSANLAQAQEAVPSIVDNYSRSRHTPTSRAVEVNGLVSEIASAASRAFTEMSALAIPAVSELAAAQDRVGARPDKQLICNRADGETGENDRGEARNA